MNSAQITLPAVSSGITGMYGFYLAVSGGGILGRDKGDLGLAGGFF